MTSPKPPSWIQGLIRPQIGGFEPYLPGKSLESVRRELGLKRIFKLASNENALGPSPKAVAAAAKVGKTAFRYPDGPSTSLRMALAKQAGVDANRVIVGAGSDELIELLGKTFLNPGDSIVVSKHAFIRYQMAGELMGCEVITVPMRDLTHDLPAMVSAIKPSTKILFIANPNNPTGTFNTQEELLALLRDVEAINRQRSTPVLVVVDEAYYEYAKAFDERYPETLPLQKTFSNLLTLRTFSKAHALAGLRIGYGYGDPEVIGAMDRVRPPFNLSVTAQAAAEASLGDKAHIGKSVKLVAQERKKVLGALDKLKLAWTPSLGNFVLIKVAPRPGKELFEKLLKRGIIVRSMDEYGFPHHIRVTYGLPAENQAFLKALEEVVRT